MSENGEIYTAGKNFTLPPALTAWTNSTSAVPLVLANFATHIMSPIRWQRHVREGSEICEELIATDRLLGADDDHEDEDLIDPERLTYFQVVNININIV